jgi:hypothetical protein
MIAQYVTRISLIKMRILVDQDISRVVCLAVLGDFMCQNRSAIHTSSAPDSRYVANIYHSLGVTAEDDI